MHRLKFTGSLTEEQFDERCRTQAHWYHSYYFDNGYQVRGDYNIGEDVGCYGFPPSLSGARVLDIGTGGGWFAHYFEQSGAEVTTVDARGYCDFDVYGRHYYPPVETEKAAPDFLGDNGKPAYYSPVSRAFALMKEILGSKAKLVNSRVYDVGPEVVGQEKFDLVFLGAILCHLRDPIGALMAAHRMCRGTLIASTPVVIGEPETEEQPRQYLPYTEIDRISWWLPNEACFRHWFLAAGLKDIDISRAAAIRCDLEQKDPKTGRILNGDQQLRVAVASSQ